MQHICNKMVVNTRTCSAHYVHKNVTHTFSQLYVPVFGLNSSGVGMLKNTIYRRLYALCLWIKIRSEDPLLHMFARLCICHNSEHRHFVLFMCLTLEASAVWFIFCRTVYVSEFGAKKLSAFARKPNNYLMKMWASIYSLACIPYHPL